MNTPDTQFGPVVSRINPDWRLLRTWEMAGGVSAQVIGLEIGLPDGRTRQLVVRCHGEADRRRNPTIAADEFRLLQILHVAGFPVPEPSTFDLSGAILPTPYIVIGYIQGETDFAPLGLPDALAQMADNLAQLHQIADPDNALSFLPRQTRGYGHRPPTLDLSLNEGCIRDVLDAAWSLHPINRTVLLHGDYWPGNILWRDEKLVGVIDWEDASLGDPLYDLGNSRLEILWAYGMEAMADFTRRYLSLTAIDSATLPYWDLCAALRPCGRLSLWGLDADKEQIMRLQHRWFVTQAIEAMG